MHLYNAFLPPPVAEETKREKEAFSGVVKSVEESYNLDDPESVYSTLKWVPVIDLLSLRTLNLMIRIHFVFQFILYATFFSIRVKSSIILNFVEPTLPFHVFLLFVFQWSCFA